MIDRIFQPEELERIKTYDPANNVVSIKYLLDTWEKDNMPMNLPIYAAVISEGVFGMIGDHHTIYFAKKMRIPWRVIIPETNEEYKALPEKIRTYVGKYGLVVCNSLEQEKKEIERCLEEGRPPRSFLDEKVDNILDSAFRIKDRK